MDLFPNYTQLDRMDCGPTCLKIIAKYYGRSISLQIIREKSHITKTGVSLLGISEAAESIGMRTRAVKLSFAQLEKERPLPCILHWNKEHFVVCYAITSGKNTKIKISDPQGEKYILNKEDFLKLWIGQKEDADIGAALLLTPSSRFYQENDIFQEKGHKLYHYFNYLIPYKSQFFQLFVGLLIGSIISLILPFLSQAMIDQGVNQQNLNIISLILIAQLVLFLTRLAMEFIRNWLTLHINTRVSISLISDFLAKLMKLPIRFFDTKNIGDIMQRIRDNGRIKSFLTGSTLVILFSFINFIVFSFILAYYSFSIFLIFLVGNILYVAWVFLFLKVRRKLDLVRFAQSSAEQSNLVQIITGMQEIKLNNCENQQRWKWEEIQVKLFRISMKSLAFGQYQQLGSAFFAQTTHLLILFIAARNVVEGSMTLGMMMSTSYIIGQLSGPISQFIGFVQSAQDAKISLERLNEIHEREDEDSNVNSSKINSLQVSRNINVRDLYFSYDGADRNYALRNVSLVIPENKITAIVGASGSGKTTLLKLLLSFYPLNKGNITIGGTDIKDINPHLWRSLCGVVMQEGFIFSDTIAKNIAIGDDVIDEAKLLHAVNVANIRDFIESLPLKYDTKIGMEGSGVSLGQKQRLLIARAVYKNPEFLFFDEATNSLDSSNERVILNNLNSFYKGRTVILIAHRLTSVQHADKIIVLDRGSIVEEGTHEELTEKRGYYYSLVKNQLELGS